MLLVFAVHALLACTIGLFQIACYERGRQRFSKASLIFSFVFIVSAGIGAATIITKPAAISKWYLLFVSQESLRFLASELECDLLRLQVHIDVVQLCVHAVLH
eukprot:SAG31_NODE_303_length_18065_cov_5.733107_2_plen_103_part_00